MPITGVTLAQGLFYDAYVYVRDKKSSGVDGGTFTTGAWQTRTINEEVADAAGICSIASNQITLAAGTYRCLISCPAYLVGTHQARLQNVTDAATLLLGVNMFLNNSWGVVTCSLVVGRFTLAAAKALEVQHRCSLTRATNGFGRSVTWGDAIFTIAEFWREA